MLELNPFVNIDRIMRGSVIFMPANKESYAITHYARNLAENIFDQNLEKINVDTIHKEVFIEKATKIKQTFTNGSKSKHLVSQLVLSRYPQEFIDRIYIDPPRVRIIPNSSFLSSGISYNYAVHRDTWYSGEQDQINHWISIANVSEQSSFYLSPTYFYRPVKNNSKVYNVSEWDKSFRNKASLNVTKEDRPHPLPIDNIDDYDKMRIILEPANEISFSGHHLHGSYTNSSNFVRFSLDYRVVIEDNPFNPPPNIDDESTGNLKDFMFKLTDFV